MLEQDQQLYKQKTKITAKYFKQNKQISIPKAVIFFKPSDEVRQIHNNRQQGFSLKATVHAMGKDKVISMHF